MTPPKCDQNEKRHNSVPPVAGHLLYLALVSFAVTGAQAQTIDNEDLALRGVTQSDGMSDTEQRRFLRSAERLTDQETDAQTEPVDRDPVLTGAVQAVQNPDSINPAQASVDTINRRDDDDPFDPAGIRIGSFILRPSITQQIAHQSERDGSASVSRTYSRTVLNSQLQSDWSRHQLTVTGEHVFDKTISGNGEEDPSTDIAADLRLDLSSTTTASFAAGYSFGQESQTDANAVNNAVAQADVQSINANASLDHLFGAWRGTVSLSGGRSTFGDAQLASGTLLTLSERDESNYAITLRAGIESGAAYTPFIEGEFGQIIYDQQLDSSGFARSSTSYALRAGIETDFGEKLTGEISAGFAQRNIDDTRLAPIQAFTVDGFATWSPRRGTDVVMALSTSLEDSTRASEPGSIFYSANAEITHELSSNLIVSASGLLGWRDYVGATANQTVYGVGSGFTWWLNRNVGIDGGITYEKTVTDGGGTNDDLFLGLGMKLQR